MAFNICGKWNKARSPKPKAVGANNGENGGQSLIDAYSPLLQMIFLFSTCALPASCHFSLSEPSDPPAGVSSVSV